MADTSKQKKTDGISFFSKLWKVLLLTVTGKSYHVTRQNILICKHVFYSFIHYTSPHVGLTEHQWHTFYLIEVMHNCCQHLANRYVCTFVDNHWELVLMTYCGCHVFSWNTIPSWMMYATFVRFMVIDLQIVLSGNIFCIVSTKSSALQNGIQCSAMNATTLF